MSSARGRVDLASRGLVKFPAATIGLGASWATGGGALEGEEYLARCARAT